MTKFNLTEEPWIPCLMLETNKTKDLSLFDVLSKAHEIKEITDNSPLVVVSLHRLLLAILHRNFGPKSFDVWKDLWRKGSWDAEKLKDYFDKLKDRFNLFDEERPFYQYPIIVSSEKSEMAKLKPLEYLMEEKASGNNATLFDHSYEANSKYFSYSTAVRYLIARQSFSFAGTGCKFPFGFSDSTLISGFSVLAIGNNLFETLALNLVRYPHEKTFIYETDDDEEKDMPFWERDNLDEATPKDRKGTIIRGYLDYLTWQSRKIKLIKEGDADSIKNCQLQQNFKLRDDFLSFDPFKVYVKSTNKMNKRGYKPIDFQEGKSLWRDSHTLFKQASSIESRSSVFDHLGTITSLIANNEIQGQKRYSFAIFGLVNVQANVSQWFHERLPLPLDLLTNVELLNHLERAIKFAEEIGEKVLQRSLFVLAWELIPNILKDEKTKKANKLANGFPVMPTYWSGLEVDFKKLMESLPNNQENSLKTWFKLVDKTAKKSLAKTLSTFNLTAIEQKAILKCEKEFNSKRKELLNKNSIYRELLDEKEIGAKV